MINYAEELAYWYLRLNGFFLIENFVIHREDEIVEHRADADLLAVRFPFVRERIGDQDVDFDDALFQLFKPPIVIGLIVEVKSSHQWNEPYIFLNPGRMEKAIHRVGFPFPPAIINELANRRQWITSNDIIRGRNVPQIGKLLIHDLNNARNVDYAASLSLNHITNFIKERFETFKNEKEPSRMFFPSSLMQYIIWKTANE